ncbi:hypothetical protein BGZ61DRAFT_468271 [Ilyonectria robusta]|uniref:uncharacterized protein n=1 Tax=Ilyonectria robusta TaxID=1079257 RepID=UPI001E8E2342|nr:uncharacterized protein BGZ61DRAFT_468271 [Ilyonectria robusta]KAH8652934.1 hypothetical protein BGZ61DRAFT_468271 [Ilyonectria robusta]
MIVSCMDGLGQAVVVDEERTSSSEPARLQNALMLPSIGKIVLAVQHIVMLLIPHVKEWKISCPRPSWSSTYKNQVAILLPEMSHVWQCLVGCGSMRTSPRNIMSPVVSASICHLEKQSITTAAHSIRQNSSVDMCRCATRVVWAERLPIPHIQWP